MFANITSFILVLGFMFGGDVKVLISAGLFAIAGAITCKRFTKTSTQVTENSNNILKEKNDDI